MNSTTSKYYMDCDHTTWREAMQHVKEVCISHNIHPSQVIELIDAGAEHITYCERMKRKVKNVTTKA